MLALITPSTQILFYTFLGLLVGAILCVLMGSKPQMKENATNLCVCFVIFAAIAGLCMVISMIPWNQ